MDTTNSPPRALWPFRLSVLIFLAAVGFRLLQMLVMSNGEVVYPLDDPYILLAMSRNIVETGFWGINAGEFSSSSSSPFWTILLAGVFSIFEPSLWWPIVLNLACGLLLLFWWHRLLPLHITQQSPRQTFFCLLALIFLLPMPTLALLGMEHLLHTLLMLICVNGMINCLSGDGIPSPTLLLLMAAGTATRYESLFLYLPLILAAFWNKQPRTGIIWTTVVTLPVAVYAAFSLYMGWHWVPNSIFLKGRNPIPGASEGLFQFYNRIDSLGTLLEQAPHLLSLLALVFFLVAVSRGNPRNDPVPPLPPSDSLDRNSPPPGVSSLRSPFALLALTFCTGTILQIGLARVGWFFRYESYLLPLGALAVFAGWARSQTALANPAISDSRRYCLRLIRFFLLAVALLLFAARGLAGWIRLPMAHQNIWQQQVQTGKFLRQNYAGKPVILNDIGAPAYFGNVYIIDLWGLGTLATAERIRTGSYYSAAELGQLAREVKAPIAILSSGFFPIPDHWKLTGTWTIPDNQVCASPTIRFFALTPEAETPLRDALKKQTAALPAAVQVREFP